MNFMFEGDYTINGIHATYIKYLVSEVKAFDRYIDVYMAGAVLGVLHDKRAKQGGGTDRARIYSDAFHTEHVKCNELFKVVILRDVYKRQGLVSASDRNKRLIVYLAYAERICNWIDETYAKFLTLLSPSDSPVTTSFPFICTNSVTWY